MKGLYKWFLLFVCACVPGCGQMYQGYMKRGLSLTVAACCLLFVAVFLGIEPLLFFLAVIWLYSFFDTWNLRRQLQNSETPSRGPEGDAFLFGLDLSSIGARAGRLSQRAHKLLGWALVLVGLYALLVTATGNLGQTFLYLFGPGWDEFGSWLSRRIRYDLPRLAVTIGIIVLGVWFIRGPKAPKPAPDYQPYTPPAETPSQKAAEAEKEARDDETGN